MQTVDMLAEGAVARGIERLRYARSTPALGVLPKTLDLLAGDVPVLTTTIGGACHLADLTLLAAAFGADTAVLTADGFVDIDGRIHERRFTVLGQPKELSDALLVAVVRGPDAAHRRLLYDRDVVTQTLEIDPDDVEVVDAGRGVAQIDGQLLDALRHPGGATLGAADMAGAYGPFAGRAESGLLHRGGHPRYRELQKTVLAADLGLAVPEGTLLNCSAGTVAVFAELLRYGP